MIVNLDSGLVEQVDDPTIKRCLIGPILIRSPARMLPLVYCARPFPISDYFWMSDGLRMPSYGNSSMPQYIKEEWSMSDKKGTNIMLIISIYYITDWKTCIALLELMQC